MAVAPIAIVAGPRTMPSTVAGSLVIAVTPAWPSSLVDPFSTVISPAPPSQERVTVTFETFVAYSPGTNETGPWGIGDPDVGAGEVGDVAGVSPVHATAPTVMRAAMTRLRTRMVRHDTGAVRHPTPARRVAMEQLELLRHAPREPEADRLSAAGRALAEEVGRSRTGVEYAAVFVSPAARAAETAAWFVRGAGIQLPAHDVVPGLAGQDATGGSPEGMAAGVRTLLDQLPDGGRGLAISHTPLIERAAFGLTGREVSPLRECEGILVTRDDDGSIGVEELRRPAA